jgi:hypothetical protein
MSHSDKQTSRAEMTRAPDAVVLAVIRYLDPDRTETPASWLTIWGYLLAVAGVFSALVWFDHWLFSP